MRAIEIRQPAGLENLQVVDRDIPSPGPGEVLVRIEASSLNFHDYLVVTGKMPCADGRIPMSDGAGRVAAVGEGVTHFKEGDAVVSTYFRDWKMGNPEPGALSEEASPFGVVTGETIDGCAAEFFLAPERAFTLAPRNLTATEAATLPCAALTAWHGLVVKGGVKVGDTVLVQGTGGVSLFGLQFAKAAGARVIATSSSDEKLERLKLLGVDEVINYRGTPKWGKEVRKLTDGRGVDQVLEIGGGNNMTQSIAACRTGGHIAIIGVLAGFAGEVPTAAIMASQQRISGVQVGNHSEQRDMIRAIEINDIKPVIDRSFPLEDIAGAFRYQESQQHFGKICLEIQ